MVAPIDPFAKAANQAPDYVNQMMQQMGVNVDFKTAYAKQQAQVVTAEKQRTYANVMLTLIALPMILGLLIGMATLVTVCAGAGACAAAAPTAINALDTPTPGSFVPPGPDPFSSAPQPSDIAR